FLATPQPYKMQKDDVPFLEALHKHDNAKNHLSDGASHAAQVIENGLSILDDIRPESSHQDQEFGPVKELGDILLNGVHIKMIAGAFGVSKALTGIVVRPHAS